MFPLIVAAIAAKTIGAGLNYFGQQKQAHNLEQQGWMEKELFGKNAALAEEQAADATARGREAELRQRFRMRQLVGAQNTAFAGQGVDISVGSPVDVKTGDQAIGEMDALTIRENAAREAMGFRKQAEIYRYQGDMALRGAHNQAAATKWQSYGTLANFAGDMFELYKGRNG